MTFVLFGHEISVMASFVRSRGLSDGEIVPLQDFNDSRLSS